MDLMIRGLEHVGLKTGPEVVVMAVYTDDFRRVHLYNAGAGYRVPKFVLEDGRLVSVPFPSPDGWEKTRIYQALYRNLTHNKYVRDHFDINAALLNRFLQNSREHGFVPVLVFIPGKSDTRSDRKRRSFLADWADAEGVAYLDLTQAIHGAGVENTYIPNNFHWNAAGHRIAAEQLHALLKARVMN
jgi:hypothetical protein